MEIHAPTPEELATLPRVIILAGPTAVGKTALSLALAKSLNAELINMDSVQIYKGLDIGSAKASLEERAEVPHHLIDVLEPNEDHNVGDFKDRALEVIADIHSRQKHAIVVGGTGLYLRVLVHGLLESPPPDATIRARHKEIAAEPDGIERLYAMLQEVDVELSQTIHHNDFVRISRGLEIFEQTGVPLSQQQREHKFKLPHLNALKIALWRPRQQLYDRINARVDMMMDAGFVEECKALYAQYPLDSNVFSSLGYRQMKDHLYESVPLDITVEQIQQKTRRYAKQQLSWLRSEPDVYWLRAPVLDEDGTIPEALLHDLRGFLEQGSEPVAAWASPHKDQQV